MQQLEIWERFKKFTLIFLYVAISILVCFSSLHFSDGATEPLFTNFLVAFPFVVTGLSALSYALFTYIEGVLKDVADIEHNKKLVSKVVESLTEVKKEVLRNAFLIISLLIVQYVIAGIQEILMASSGTLFALKWLFLSVRSSVFLLVVLAGVDQFKGFIIAQDYRNVLQDGKKHK